MAVFRSPVFALVVASLGIAAALGGSAGMVAAGTRPFALGVGDNYTGPLQGDVQPTTFVACLPVASWRAMYLWDNTRKEWYHYFNTTKGIPEYVNLPSVGGITIIKRGAGLALIMDQAVANPYLKDSESDSCPP